MNVIAGFNGLAAALMLGHAFDSHNSAAALAAFSAFVAWTMLYLEEKK